MATLEQKVLIFEEMKGFEGIQNELLRGGLDSKYTTLFHDYASALETIQKSSGYPAAVLHCNLSENPDKVDLLHQALRLVNPPVEIYHAIAGGAGSLGSLICSGVLSLNVKGILPMNFGGPAENNYFCQLGKELQQKYFS